MNDKTITEQTYFSFNIKSEPGIIVGEFNKQAIDFLFNNNWFLSSLQQVLFLYGESYTGKTYITELYIRKNNGIVINTKNLLNYSNLEALVKQHNVLLLENFDKLNKNYFTGLFNLYNLVVENNKKLIITSATNINNIKIELKDLKSRLYSAMFIEIKQPNDTDLKKILIKMLSDKQLLVNEEIVSYLLTRIERNIQSTINITNKIEELIMKEKKQLSVSLLKRLT